MGWDGQPRAVVVDWCSGQQCALVASPGKEVKRNQGKGTNQFKGTKKCKEISDKILKSKTKSRSVKGEEEIGKEDAS